MTHTSAAAGLLQVTIAGGVGQQQVKQLAYDLCKTVALLPSDYSLLVDGIKVSSSISSSLSGYGTAAGGRQRAIAAYRLMAGAQYTPSS